MVVAYIQCLNCGKDALRDCRRNLGDKIALGGGLVQSYVIRNGGPLDKSIPSAVYLQQSCKLAQSYLSWSYRCVDRNA